MEENIQYEEFIKITSFGKKEKKVHIIGNLLTYDKKTINLDDVTEMRYGVKPYQIYRFYIGWNYCIDLKTKDAQIKIEFISFLKFSINYFNELIQRIIKKIWSYTMPRIVNESINKIISGQVIQVDKYQLSKQGINWNNKQIAWCDLNYQKNYDRLTINSKSNIKIWTNIYYLELYNADVIVYVCDWVIKQDGLNNTSPTHVSI